MARVVEVSGSLLHLVVESRQFMVNMIAVARCKPPADAIVTGDVVRVVSDTETLRTLQLLHARADDNWALVSLLHFFYTRNVHNDDVIIVLVLFLVLGQRRSCYAH